MKKVNLLFLILAFILLTMMCSGMSMCSVGREYRFTAVVMNPWNGVEGIYATICRFLHTGKTMGILLTAGLLSLLWWRLYALLRRIFQR